MFPHRTIIAALTLSITLGMLPAMATVEPTEPPRVEPLTEPMAVIPPGHENLLAEMLGRGVTLPGECKFANGKVENEIVTATYTCAAGEVIVILRHPTKAAGDATLTEEFAISVQSGSPPSELKEELASRIRSREGEFEWTWLAPETIPESSNWVTIIVAGLLAGAVLWLLLRRRRQPA